MKKIIYKKLSYLINGLCFQVHNELGRFCKEKQYCDKLEEMLKNSDIIFKREYDLKKLNNEFPGGNRVDFIVENKVVLEIKAKSIISKDDYYQVLRYLKASNVRLGMIINFRNKYLKPKRIINNEYER